MAMNERLRAAFEREMAQARSKYADRAYRDAFRHLERAHVLGQRFAIAHTRTHIWMLKVGIATRNMKEIVGQSIRIPVGFIGSAVGLVPVGNTGGADVPATRRMAIPDDLKQYLE